MSYQVELVSIGSNGTRVTTTKDGFLFTTIAEVNEYIDSFIGSISTDLIVISGWENAPTHHLEIDVVSGLDVAVPITDIPIDSNPPPIEPTPPEI